MNENNGLEYGKRLIEKALGWGDPSSWTNEDFEELSDRIFTKTDVRLSVSTLKRIWGKIKYDHTPTTATLNALARFAGYTTWRELQQSVPAIPARRRFRPFLTPLVILTLTGAAILALLSARLSHPPTAPFPLRFDSHYTSDGLPNSVVFNY